MKPQCIKQVQAAAGRALTAAEIKGIDDRMDSAMRQLARKDPQGWQAKSMDTRVLEAAKVAMGDMKAEAQRKVANAKRQAIKTLETQQRIGELRQNLGGSSQSRALVEDLNNTHLYSDSIKRQYTGGMMALIEASSSTHGTWLGRKALQFLFDMENPQMTIDLAKEIFANGAGVTGNKLAQKGAKAWLQTIEGMRTRFNDAGGDVGKLDYGYLPQPHDSIRIREAGRGKMQTAPALADAQAKWVADTLPLLDRKQYVQADGRILNDAELQDMLAKAWETLASDGMNKQTPGQFKGPGAKANAGSESRVLHFKDGDSYLAYNAAYGSGSMYDAMIGHIGGMARNIGLVERMGPNPNNQFRLQLDLAERADGKLERVFGNKPTAYWDVISGNTGAAESQKLAAVGQHIRNIQTMGKLAGAVISSITDLSTMMVTTGFNKLSYWDLLRNTMTAGGKEAREFANMHGMIAESMVTDLNRWQGENIANNWSGRLANSTMKLSLMNAWTDTMRRGFSLTMMGGLGKLAKTEWSKLTEWDRAHLGRKGITEADWQVVNAAQLTDYRGQQMLTPEAIAAADIEQARPQDLQRIRDRIATESADLMSRNAQDQKWIQGRIDKFDEARDSLNKWVKDRLQRRLDKNEKATGPMLERMALLDAQREAAKLQADIEADYNKLFTKADIDAFNSGLRGAAGDFVAADKSAISAAEVSGRKFGAAKQRIETKMRELQKKAAASSDAEKSLIAMSIKQMELERAQLQNEIEMAFNATTDSARSAFRDAVAGISSVSKSANAGISAAEKIGAKYGEAKGKLQRRMQEIENRIVQMDKEAFSAANADGKEVAKKADAMLADLRDYIKRSQERQQRRLEVVARIQGEEGDLLAKESQRIKNEVTAKILGFITDESEYAVMNPDVATRAIQTAGGTQAGTIKGELARSVMQFKSFPIAMISRHWRRILDSQPGLDGSPALANKAAYTAALLLTTTALGAIAFQTKQVVQGKDPVDMTTEKFWWQAAGQGGGLGFVADILLGDTTQDRSPMDSLGRMLLGPSFGSAAEIWELTKGNRDEWKAGKDTHAGAEAIRFAKSHLPYVNLWYGKAALDHFLLHSIQENLSPGYLARIKNKAQKDWEQDWYWQPGEAAPDRAPDFAATMGE